MLIALDYDGTWTEDETLWREFVKLARRNGHQVIVVTLRSGVESLFLPCEVIFTSGRAKRDHCESLGLHPDIWIDDNPHYILNSVKKETT